MNNLVKQRTATRRYIDRNKISYMDQIQQILDLVMENPNPTDDHYDDEVLEYKEN